jgi:hypothetical protein
MLDSKNSFAGLPQHKLDEKNGSYNPKENGRNTKPACLTWVFVMRFALIATMFSVYHFLPQVLNQRNLSSDLKPVVYENTCAQPSPPAHGSNLSSFTDAPGFAKEAAERLAGAVRVPTM